MTVLEIRRFDRMVYWPNTAANQLLIISRGVRSISGACRSHMMETTCIVTVAFDKS